MGRREADMDEMRRRKADAIRADAQARPPAGFERRQCSQETNLRHQPPVSVGGPHRQEAPTVPCVAPLSGCPASRDCGQSRDADCSEHSPRARQLAPARSEPRKGAPPSPFDRPTVSERRDRISLPPGQSNERVSPHKPLRHLAAGVPVNHSPLRPLPWRLRWRLSVTRP